MFTEQDGKYLLKLARDSIREEFGDKVAFSTRDKKRFSDKRGVFVTLTIDGELRGCIGIPYPIKDLWNAVYSSAKDAAFSDPRFPPLEKKDLSSIKIDVSVLTLPSEIKCKKEDLPGEIKVGKDGLIVEYGHCKGLLLPQVAPEWHWDSLEFLEHTCEKAGLPFSAWKDEKCKIYKFQAQVFEE